MSTPKGVRAINENVVQPGRAFIITDLNDVAWDQIPNGSLYVNPHNGIMLVKLEDETTWVPAGVKNDGTLVISRDTALEAEVFTVTNLNNGDGTFTYKNTDGEQRYKEKSPDGYIFELEHGTYFPGRNHLSVLVNGNKEYTAVADEIVELDFNRFKITAPIAKDDKLLVRYIKWVKIGNPYPRFFEGNTEPADAEVGDFFLDFSEGMDVEPSSLQITWNQVTGKPTTITGYGIVDDLSYVGHRHVVGDVNGLQNTLDAARQELEQLANNLFKPGMIIDWYGDISTIPTGWHICDGSNGTPDLRDKFVIGAGRSYVSGATGGSEIATLNEDQLPAHNHDIELDPHDHDRGTMNITGTFSGVGHHYVNAGFDSTVSGAISIINTENNPPEGVKIAESDDAQRDDYFGFDASRSWDGRTESVTVTGASAVAGGGQPHDNMPPYYALYKIMYIGNS